MDVLRSNNIAFKVIHDVLYAEHNGNKYYFEKFNGEYEIIRNICNYISNLSTNNALTMLGKTEDDIYSDVIGDTLGNLKLNLDTVYHWTNAEALEEIMSTGYLNPSYGTGINNRGAFGIFTTVDIEEYADGVYGDVLLEIDLGSFRTSVANLDDFDISFEPEVMDYYIRMNLVYLFNADCIFDYPSDVRETTIIINAAVPVKYIRVLD